MESQLLLYIGLPVATPILWEVARRWGARKMSGPRLTTRCQSVGDEYGHRKWNVWVENKGPKGMFKKLFDARSQIAQNVRVSVRFLYETAKGVWDEEHQNQPFELLWSSNIPNDPAGLLGDASLIERAKSIDVPLNKPEAVAVAIKVRNGGSASAGILAPNAYLNGLPGDPTNKPLRADRYIVEISLTHALDSSCSRQYFVLRNTGVELSRFLMEKAQKREKQIIKDVLRRSLEGKV